MKRIWDEVYGEWHDYDPACEEEQDAECPEEIIATEARYPDIDLVMGWFNGGRHTFIEIQGEEKILAEFEEKFQIVQEAYDLGASQKDLEETIRKCAEHDLDYLRIRKREYDEERECAEATHKATEAKELSRWERSEWHDLEKLAQAARDAGWQEHEPDHHYGPEHKRYGFYHDIGPADDGCVLRLELDIDDSNEYHAGLWLSDGCDILYPSGSTSTFGGWNQLPGKQYVSDMEFIDRWLGIPTPTQAIQSLKLILDWDNFMGRHMGQYCSKFTF